MFLRAEVTPPIVHAFDAGRRPGARDARGRFHLECLGSSSLFSSLQAGRHILAGWLKKSRDRLRATQRAPLGEAHRDRGIRHGERRQRRDGAHRAPDVADAEPGAPRSRHRALRDGQQRGRDRGPRQGDLRGGRLDDVGVPEARRRARRVRRFHHSHFASGARARATAHPHWRVATPRA